MGKILKIIFFNGFAVATRGGLWREKGQGAGARGDVSLPGKLGGCHPPGKFAVKKIQGRI